MEWQWEIRKFWAFGEDLSKGLRPAPSRFLFLGFFFVCFVLLGNHQAGWLALYFFLVNLMASPPQIFVSMVFLFCVCVSCPVLRFLLWE